MQNYNKKVILKKGKDFPVKNKHLWIFSGAIERAEPYENGEILKVYSSNNEFLGHGYFNSKTTIAGRMLNFSSEDPMTSIKKNINTAVKLRSQLMEGKNTNAYRLINGENDNMPGLIADIYNDILVIQISTVGMDKIKPVVIDSLIDLFGKNITIYERSTMPARRIDGLKDFEGFINGEKKQRTQILENGIKFEVDVAEGQKTGFFLDMREMRSLIGGLSRNKKVLNCFSYSGGFSLYALKGGASYVTSVEISEQANQLSKMNFELNGYDHNKNKIVTQDVFEFLKKDELNYDIVILDPPAFAKKKQDIDNATRKYIELNKLALSKMKPGSILLTCSCSYYMDEESFDKVIKRAGVDTNKDIRLLSKHRMAQDHAINIYNTEFDYLKSRLLYII